ncbi:hypothetical protein [Paraburkholderia solisilvae]|nr:hypothetical protein [Paraburkholderia solisilvae]
MTATWDAALRGIARAAWNGWVETKSLLRRAPDVDPHIRFAQGC